MTREQAFVKGFTVFTGVYSRDKEEVKFDLLGYIEKYPKVEFRLVTIPDSPLSRGTIGRGYSLYATEAYTQYKRLADAEFCLASHNQKLLNALNEYQKVLDTIMKRYDRAIEDKRIAEEFLSKL